MTRICKTDQCLEPAATYRTICKGCHATARRSTAQRGPSVENSVPLPVAPDEEHAALHRLVSQWPGWAMPGATLRCAL